MYMVIASSNLPDFSASFAAFSCIVHAESDLPSRRYSAAALVTSWLHSSYNLRSRAAFDPFSYACTCGEVAPCELVETFGVNDWVQGVVMHPTRERGAKVRAQGVHHTHLRRVVFG
jgi:hypothetical protein